MTDTEREINRLISYIRSCRKANIDCTVTVDKSLTHGILNALVEVRQYRKLGTVEELTDAIQVMSESSDDVDENGISIGTIKDLAELAKYRKLGTVEEVKESVLRDTAEGKAYIFINALYADK